MTQRHRFFVLARLTASGLLVVGCAAANTSPTEAPSNKAAAQAPSSTPSGPPAASSAGPAKAQLTVEVTGLAAQKGFLNFAVIDSAENWNGAKNAVAGVTAKVTGSTMRFVFQNLQPGKMAIRLFQDEDGNGKLDANMFGVPTEGYGFSGKPTTMGPPSFEDAAFILPASGTVARIEVQ